MPNGAEENFRWGDRREPPFFYFYKERLGTGSPPHPPQCAHWGTFPPRGRLWVEKNPASQTSGPRKGRNKIQSVFCTDTRRAKNSAHPESASFAGAVRGASPNFGSPAQRVPKFLPPPSPPSRWAGRYGRKIQGRRPGRKKRDPPQGPPDQSRESRGEKLSPLALFPPVSRGRITIGSATAEEKGPQEGSNLVE